MNELQLTRVDANLLVALDALLVERSVTRAAERLGLSQSALSHKLRRLRDLLDDELLIPTRGGMVPTQRAEGLAPTLRSAVAGLQKALTDEPSFDPATATFDHRVMSSDYAELVAMPHVVEATRRLSRDISITLLPPGPDMAGALARGDVHVVVAGPLDGPGLRRRVLYDEQTVCAVRADHEGVGETLDLATWLGLDHVRFSREGSATLTDEVLARSGHERRVVVTTPHLVGGPLIAARTDLVCTGLSAPIREIARMVPLRVFPAPVEIRSDRLAVVMTWHERFDRDPAARWMWDFTARCTIEAAQRHGLAQNR